MRKINNLMKKLIFDCKGFGEKMLDKNSTFAL